MTDRSAIHLDNAATTRPLRAVVDAMAKAQFDLFGNPSSAHSFGPPAKKALDRYRLERMLIVRGRALVQRSPLLRRLLGTMRLGADVLLRE